MNHRVPTRSPRANRRRVFAAACEALEDRRLLAMMVPFYNEDFQSTPGGEWDYTTTNSTPEGGRHVLGPLGPGDVVTVDLTSIPTGRIGLVVEFDLIVIGDQDAQNVSPGVACSIVGTGGIDFTVTDGTTPANYTFANLAGDHSYPATAGNASNNPKTGYIESNTLGYTIDDPDPTLGGCSSDADSIYHVVYSFYDNNASRSVALSADSIPGTDNTQWAVDNFVVRAMMPEATGGAPQAARGEVSVNMTTLGSSGLGSPWQEDAIFSNFGRGLATDEGHRGNGWFSSVPAFLGSAASTIVEIAGIPFTFNGSTFTPLIPGETATAIYDTVGAGPADDVVIFTDQNCGCDAVKMVFEMGGTQSATAGKLKSMTDPYGNVTTVAYNGAGFIANVDRSVTGAYERYLYTYTTPTGRADLASVALQRGPNSGALSTVRVTEFTFHDGSGDHGNRGDLQFITVKDGSGNTIDTSYLTSHKTTDNGYVGGLQFVFGPAAYERLRDSVAGGGDVTALSSSAIDDYADRYFVYDPLTHQVEEEVLAGAGDDSLGGHGAIATAYTTSGNGDGYNSWKNKAVQTLANGNQQITYTNYLGQPMLEVFVDTASSPDKQWFNYRQYDLQGRVTLMATTSAAIPDTTTGAAFDDTSADLMNWSVGNSALLHDSNGIVEITSYYDERAVIDDTVAGGAPDRVYEQLILHGELGDSAARKTITIARTGSTATASATAHGYAVGDTVVISGANQSEYNGVFVITAVATNTFDFLVSGSPANPATGTIGVVRPIRQARYQYFEQADGGITTYPLATSTQYRNADGTGGQTTSFAYTWYSGTVGVESKAVTLPTVTTGQNGPNSAVVETTFFDSFGRTQWTKDGDGSIQYFAYDPATGAMTRHIADVDTDNTGDFDDLPGGWSSPSGLHLITDMEVDAFGRTTKLTDPLGNLTYTIYRDPQHEVRTYRGWNASTDLATGPTEVVRDDRGRGYVEYLTMTASPNVSSHIPLGTESIGSLQSLTRQFTNEGGQVTRADAYFSLPSYSTGSMGTLNTHFYRTTYGYDSMGRQDRVVNAVGTITRTIYDAPGRVKEVHVGTDDAATGGTWPTTTTDTDMVIVSAYTYDGGATGDGNLTSSTDYSTSTSTDDRITDYFYDWRNRLVAMKQRGGATESGSTSVQRPITYFDLDNLGQTLGVYSYDGDNVSVSISNQVPQQPSSGLLRAKSTSEYDEWGRVYASHVLYVNPSSGSVGNSLDSYMWYDKRGNVIKSTAPGSPAQKFVYDGAGRLVRSYLSDGGGDPAAGASSNWDHADDVTGDIVVEQYDTNYDKNGNAIFSTQRVRFHDDASTTGELGSPTTSGLAKARTYASSAAYDAINRTTSTVNLGALRGGKASSATSSTLVDSTRTEATDYFVGHTIRIVSGTGAGQTRTVSGYNGSTDTFTVSSNWTTTPDSTSVYVVYANTTSTATSGSSSTLVDTARTEANDFFNGRSILIVSGTGAGQIRLITDYNGSSDTFDVSPNWAVTPDATSVYQVSSGLISSYTYDAAGYVEKVTDPRGIVTKSTYDALGRATQVVEAYVNGSPSADDDRTTDYTYDGVSHVRTMTATLPSAVVQVTEYVYGVTVSGGSHINSNDLLATIKYPDASTGAASSSGDDQESFKYYRTGQVYKKTDQNGSVHEYTFDVLGRLTSDELTAGGGVDDAIVTLGYTYDSAGMPEKFTSYDGKDAVVNEVKRVYNGFGQLTVEYQEHDGAVDGGTPMVQYTYTEASGGNHSRLVKVTYPNGRGLYYGYNAGLDSTISRLSFMADDDGFGTAGQHVEEYQYLGLDTVVVRDHPEAQSKLTLVKLVGESDGAQGDQYNGLDRFGRVADQRWVNGSGADLDRFKYGYDNDGNVLFKQNAVSSTHSELYHADGAGNGYDNLNRLTQFQRGSLSDANSDGVLDTVGTSTRMQGWTLDALGNWSNVAEGTTSLGTAVVRTHDKQNKITDADTLGGGGAMDYDDNGNTIVDETGLQYFHDGWNRLVEVQDDGDASLKTYQYDALGRRIVEIPDGEDETELYYSSMWQVLEERLDGDVAAQNVWSPVYIDALVLRDRDASSTADGTLDSAFDSDGVVVFDAGGGSTNDHANDVLALPDGDVLVVGIVGDDSTPGGNNNGDFTIARVNPDGSVAEDFAVDFGGDDGAFAVAADPSTPGDYYVVGYNENEVLVYRYSDDVGRRATFYTGIVGTAADIAVQSDGYILIAGTDGGGDAFVVRYSTGMASVDTGFGSGGTATVDFGGSDLAAAIALQADGKVLLLGATYGGDFAVARLTSSGALDTSTYGVSGLRTINFGTNDMPTDLVIQPDGKAIVVGGSDGDFAVARLTTAGALDETFGSGGKVTTSFGGSEDSQSVALQPDGKVIVAGFGLGGLGGVGVARYTSAGALDTTFDGDGKLTATGLVGQGLALRADGSIVVAGADGSGDTLLLRFIVASGLEERLYVQQDGNFNVTGIVDVYSVVVERFEYDSYGLPTFLNGDFSVDVSGSDYGWDRLHQGGQRDEVTGLYSFRHRWLSPTLGRWMTQDPTGYADGASLFEALRSSPLRWLDSHGLAADKDGWEPVGPIHWDMANPVAPPRHRPAGMNFNVRYTVVNGWCMMDTGFDILQQSQHFLKGTQLFRRKNPEIQKALDAAAQKNAQANNLAAAAPGIEQRAAAANAAANAAGRRAAGVTAAAVGFGALGVGLLFGSRAAAANPAAAAVIFTGGLLLSSIAGYLNSVANEIRIQQMNLQNGAAALDAQAKGMRAQAAALDRLAQQDILAALNAKPWEEEWRPIAPQWTEWSPPYVVGRRTIAQVPVPMKCCQGAPPQ